MHELIISLEHDVSHALAPITSDCDSWWWYLDDNVPVFRDDDIAATYDDFMTMSATTRVGHPGWCSRFIGYMEAQQNAYVAISSRDYPASTIHEIDRIDEDDLLYMSPLELGDALPADVPLVCRFFHMAYYSLVFRSRDHARVVEKVVPRLGPEWAPHKMR